MDIILFYIHIVYDIWVIEWSRRYWLKFLRQNVQKLYEELCLVNEGFTISPIFFIVIALTECFECEIFFFCEQSRQS